MKFLFDKDTWQEIYGSIRKNKTRTAITIFGAFWGILLLVGLLGAAKGIENGFNSMFGDFATNSVFMAGGRTSKPFKGFQEGRQITLTTSDVDKIRNEVNGVEFVVPRNVTGGLVVNGLKTANLTIFGDYPLLDKIQKKNLTEGRFINQSDIDENKKVCVISTEVYKQLFDRKEEALGTYIKINDIGYKIIGIYKPGRFEGPNNIHIPFSTFKLVYNRGNKFQWMVVTGKPEFNIEQVESDVKVLLRSIHKIHPEDNRAFNGFNLGKEIAKVTGFLTGMQFLTWFVGIATLIAGVFAIGNILLITVKERTKEIGIRRALGATPGKIRQQIILESVFLTLLAGSLGIIAGGGVLMIIDKLDLLTNPTVDIPIVLIAYTVLIVLGTLIGFIPAYMATIIQPIEALREE
ncbi:MULTISPECIES: ABC transporter permease [unclassified Tenacibaculum]|uniref:ABC transporter permease n=1 Tax=unclassified Tenacibaculum TaxID=2635139 RepID=UPI001F29DCB1|nr:MULTISPECIES: ABC transporter permease [unclassified Tenacibaculum]MCF2873889.1 ABC transporter permease [Tenacibaculum sp. Cn5-1]MCF2936699.1 ABC transporter permease [Tenacibaculum sp. Cn5-34]MCG7512923.1 ABC transporter permease [Tenacibaculum sp. Cn5-46]